MEERAWDYSGMLCPEPRSVVLTVPGKIQDQMLRDPRWRLDTEPLCAPGNSKELYTWRGAGWRKHPPGGWEGNLSQATALGWGVKKKKKRPTENLDAQAFPPIGEVWKYTIYMQGTPKGKLTLSASLSKSPLAPGRCKGKIVQTPQESHSQWNMIKSKNYQKLKKQTTWKGLTTTTQQFRTKMLTYKNDQIQNIK